MDDSEALLLHSVGQAVQENIWFLASVLVFHTVRPILVLEALNQIYPALPSYSCNVKVTFAYFVLGSGKWFCEAAGSLCTLSRLYNAGADEQLIWFHTGHSTSSGGGAYARQWVSTFQDFWIGW